MCVFFRCLYVLLNQLFVLILFGAQLVQTWRGPTGHIAPQLSSKQSHKLHTKKTRPSLSLILSRSRGSDPKTHEP